MGMAQLSQNRLAYVRAVWDPLVDPPLTRFRAKRGNTAVDAAARSAVAPFRPQAGRRFLGQYSWSCASSR
jgi:hypothetical protein